MSKINRDALKEAVLESQNFKKFKKIVIAIRDDLDLDKIEGEIKSLHAGRLARNLEATKINPKVMIEANVREIAYRSRLVEIRVSLTDHKNNLYKATKAIKKFLITEFELPGLRGKEARMDYFHRFFRAGENLMEDIDRLIDTCDHFVKDIDQAGYGMKQIKECMDMIYTKERTI